MKTNSYYSISQEIDGEMVEVERTEAPAAAATFINNERRRKESSMLSLKLIFETLDRFGYPVASREYLLIASPEMSLIPSLKTLTA